MMHCELTNSAVDHGGDPGGRSSTGKALVNRVVETEIVVRNENTNGEDTKYCIVPD